jgi:TRAP transporter TAXI family solute receptor
MTLWVLVSRGWLLPLVGLTWLVSTSCSAPAAHPIQEFTFLTQTSPAFARGLVEHYNQTVPFVHVTSKIERGGAPAIVADLRTGSGQIGIVQQADAVYLAYRHGVEGDPVPYVNLRGVAVMWRNILTVVVQRSGHYRTLTDLRGKRVGIYPAGTATEFLSRALLRVYGMTYADVQPVFDANSATLIENDQIDAAIFVTPATPDPVIEAQRPDGHLALLPIPRSVIGELLRMQPFLHPAVIPASGRPGGTGDLETVGIDALLVCRDDLADDIVYQFTKEFFAALPELAKSNSEAANIDIETAPATPIPLHTGAARYYREREVLK